MQTTALELPLDEISGPLRAEEALVIELLIRAHVPEWDDEIDYTSIRRLSAESTDDPLKHRYADNVWRGRSSDAATEYMLSLEYCDQPERHMALQTTVNSGLAVQELFRHDKELERGDRDLAVACVVVYDGNRPWNDPKHMRDLFRHSNPGSFRVIWSRPKKAPPPTPLDLPQMLLGLAGVSTVAEMRDELQVLGRVVRDCEDEEFDRRLTGDVKGFLRSKGMFSEALDEARTMQALATAFERSVAEIT